MGLFDFITKRFSRELKDPAELNIFTRWFYRPFRDPTEDVIGQLGMVVYAIKNRPEREFNLSDMATVERHLKRALKILDEKVTKLSPLSKSESEAREHLAYIGQLRAAITSALDIHAEAYVNLRATFHRDEKIIRDFFERAKGCHEISKLLRGKFGPKE